MVAACLTARSFVFLDSAICPVTQLLKLIQATTEIVVGLETELVTIESDPRSAELRIDGDATIGVDAKLGIGENGDAIFADGIHPASLSRLRVRNSADHESAPYLRRNPAAARLAKRCIVVITNPYSDDKTSGEAHKECVAAILARTCLAECGDRKISRATCTVRNRCLQKIA